LSQKDATWVEAELRKHLDGDKLQIPPGGILGMSREEYYILCNEAVNANPSIIWSEELSNAEYLIIEQGEFYLLDTLEYVTLTPEVDGVLFLRSSMGRRGFEHSHAGYFDPAFDGTGTLEVTNIHPWPVVIKKGQPIVQLVLGELDGTPDRDYRVTGKYVGQRGPQPPRSGRLDEVSNKPTHLLYPTK
jgi:deoxycytidine triphosphate deaminase